MQLHHGTCELSGHVYSWVSPILQLLAVHVWLSAGLLLLSPHAFVSVQTLVCVPAEHADHCPHCQFGVHGGGGEPQSLGQVYWSSLESQLPSPQYGCGGET
jgi:hypothetical protein